MLRIKRISNPFNDDNRQTLEKVKAILREQFSGVKEEKINQIPHQMIDPVKYGFQTHLVVADDYHENIKAFGVLLFMADIKICWLDYIAVKPGGTSGGLGGALFERIREEAKSLGSQALYFECLPDDPKLCKNQALIVQNRKRLAFYEKYGARPVTGTLYETPVNEGDDCPPYIVYDALGRSKPLDRSNFRKAVKSILERKYADYCPPEYIKKVVDSVQDDPVRLRDFKYLKAPEAEMKPLAPGIGKIMLTVNDKHEIHHIKEVGYVEAPVRVASILKEISKTQWFTNMPVKEFPDKWILQVHDRKYFDYFKKVCDSLAPGKSVYPYVFPIRNSAIPPVELSVRAGYYCIDTFTPLNKNAFLAARHAVNCSLTLADELLKGATHAYALVRPPGHHAERYVYGGFCYFNNNAVAANYLSKHGKVAIIDLDYHHGNGQQQIFYDRDDVLTISIHGHPSFAYPYFSGFRNETGEGRGKGFNVNYPLKEVITPEEYRTTLLKAINVINKFKPDFVIVALGLDPSKGDPTGTWSLGASDFHKNGEIIGTLNQPLLVIQEGGYKTKVLGVNAKSFFAGVLEARRLKI